MLCVTPEIALQTAINSLFKKKKKRRGWFLTCLRGETCLSLVSLSLSLTLSLLFPFIPFQMLPDLKADNQRLKDENGALIRVISKLSK